MSFLKITLKKAESNLLKSRSQTIEIFDFSQNLFLRCNPINIVIQNIKCALNLENKRQATVIISFSAT